MDVVYYILFGAPPHYGISPINKPFSHIAERRVFITGWQYILLEGT
jgi:hypothetical protein